MPRRYNLRKRDTTVKWIEDDTLIEKETDSDSEDEDYVPPSEEESDVDESLVDEDDDESEPRMITVPIPKNGRITIEIDNRDTSEEDHHSDHEEEEEQGGFLDYLVNKYVPSRRIKELKAKSDDEEEQPALDLNDEDITYFGELPKSRQRKLNKQMKSLSALVSDGGIPYKFRVLELPVSDAIKATVIKKLVMLDKMDSDGGETHKLRTWIDGFLRIPFGTIVPLPVKLTDGQIPCSQFLSDTCATLDKAVYGMQGAKTQIMQILAQWLSNPESVGNVIALRGPMGVGKTSFARNGIANVLKRPFQFFSLGGATDSANFVGHAYTYEGSTWGRIADGVMASRCMNPVMYFDELDKISTTPQGEEIVSMLIHLTDRSQNSQFHDRYFAGIDFDLSQCLFVFSFNDESKLHPVLKDRMQVIHCAGYNADEKRQILTHYIWPQILDRIRIPDVTIADEAIKHLISEYSSGEEGVRTLIRAVETLMTRVNLLRIANEETAKLYKFYTKIEFPFHITADRIKHILQDMGNPIDESWRRLYT